MFLVGVAGGSGSGKTTFAKKVLQSLGQDEGVLVLHQDSYYLPSPPSHLMNAGEANFDHPDAFDWQLLFDHMRKLRQGKQIHVPTYDFKAGERLRDTQSVGPCQAVMFEGIYALWHEKVRELLDVKVYLHVDADIRFIRRLHRDVRERGRTVDSVIRQYYDTVRPMHHEYLEPTRQFADVTVGEETDIAAQVLAARIRQVIGQVSAGKVTI